MAARSEERSPTERNDHYVTLFGTDEANHAVAHQDNIARPQVSKEDRNLSVSATEFEVSISNSPASTKSYSENPNSEREYSESESLESSEQQFSRQGLLDNPDPWIPTLGVAPPPSSHLEGTSANILSYPG